MGFGQERPTWFLPHRTNRAHTTHLATRMSGQARYRGGKQPRAHIHARAAHAHACSNHTLTPAGGWVGGKSKSETWSERPSPLLMNPQSLDSCPECSLRVIECLSACQCSAHAVACLSVCVRVLWCGRAVCLCCPCHLEPPSVIAVRYLVRVPWLVSYVGNALAFHSRNASATL